MIEAYLIGSIYQSLERLRQLRQIVQGSYPREYDGLRQICLTGIDTAQSEFTRLAEETVVDTALQTPRRLRIFTRNIRQIEHIENIGAFALSRINQDDDFLNRQITEICREIGYPLIPPVVSHSSQDYIHIYLGFNLLCLPLVESRFLLHLPDLYHELCHPFHRKQNADLPVLDRYHSAYKQCLFKIVRHFGNEVLTVERLSKPVGLSYQLQLWQTCWVKFWMEEFFCDLFAVMVAGPSFAWSHYHLCVKRGGNPFKTPVVYETTHPADDARMRVMLKMLAAAGFEGEVSKIETAWSEYVEIMKFDQEPEYQQCYSIDLLSEIVLEANKGIDGIGIVVAKPGDYTPVVNLLNTAWHELWRDPKEYKDWEISQVVRLWNKR